jgi:hypothetical protein
VVTLVNIASKIVYCNPYIKFLSEINTVPPILLPCKSCTRTFRPEALAKHSKICEKTLMKKRKKFDSSKQRIQGTDLAQFVPSVKTSTLKKKEPSSRCEPSNQSKWKEKHTQLVQTIREARNASDTNDTSMNKSTSLLKSSDHDQCPYCERHFGPKAYDRHIEWCKEHQTRVKAPTQASLEAKERLEARTKVFCMQFFLFSLFKSPLT